MWLLGMKEGSLPKYRVTQSQQSRNHRTIVVELTLPIAKPLFAIEHNSSAINEVVRHFILA